MSVYLIDYENVHFAGWEGIEDLIDGDEVVLFYSDNASTIPMDLSIKVSQSRARLQYIKVNKTAKNYLDFQLSALTGYLVATMKQQEYVVVSKDTGYDAVLDFWNNQEFVGRKLHFVRRDQIALRPVEKAKKAQARTGKGGKPKKAEQKRLAPKGKKETRKEPKPVQKKEVHAEPKKDPVSVKKPLALTAQDKARVRSALKGLDLIPSDYSKIYRLLRNEKDKHDYNILLVKAFKDQEKGNQIYKATLKIFTDRLKG